MEQIDVATVIASVAVRLTGNVVLDQLLAVFTMPLMEHVIAFNHSLS